MKGLHHGRSKLKVEFDVHVQQLTGVEALEGRAVFVCWKRGSRKKSGMTRRALVQGGVARFNEHIIFSGTLFTDTRGAADAKVLQLYVREASARAGEASRLLFKRAVDVARLAQVPDAASSTAPASLLLDPAGGSSASASPAGTRAVLVAAFVLRPTSFDERLLRPVAAGASPPAGPVTVIGGRTYALGEHVSEPDSSAADTVTSDDWDDDYDGGDFGADAASSCAGGAHSRSSSSVGAGASPAGAAAAELAAARREIESLQADNRQLRLTLAELQRTVRELRQQHQGGNNGGSSSTNSGSAGSASGSEGGGGGGDRGSSAGSAGEADVARAGPTLTGLARNLSMRIVPRRPARAVTGAMLTDTFRDAYDRLAFVDQTLYRAPLKLRGTVPVTAPLLCAELERWRTFQDADEEQVRALSRTLAAICEACAGSRERTAYWVATLCALLTITRRDAAAAIAAGGGGGGAGTGTAATTTTTTGTTTTAAAPNDQAARVENTRGVFDACLTNLLFVEYKSIVATMMDAVEPFLVATFFVGPSGGCGSSSTTVVSVVMARTLAALRKYCVPHGFTQQVYAQLCYQLAGTLVNHLLRQARYCTPENGMRLVLQTRPLVQWLARNDMPQAADQFTVLHDVSRLLSTNKAFLAEPNVLSTICPTMSFTLARLIASSCPDTFVPSSSLTVSSLSRIFVCLFLSFHAVHLMLLNA